MSLRLRIASWNVLADAYIRPDWFPGTPPEMLTPGARTEAVLDIVEALSADVIALQEADPELVEATRQRLQGWDVRWCPKGGAGRPDGCLTAVRSALTIASESRLVYDDGLTPSGHVAHLVTVADHTGNSVVVANTHLRWATAGTPVGLHLGVRQARELVQHLSALPAAVIAADTNDLPGGPVRQVLTAGGYLPVHGDVPTSLFNGSEPRALDVVAVRWCAGVVVDTRIPVEPQLPGTRCPSDHVPVVADIDLA